MSFPWNAALAFGLGRLRLAPEVFWRMTPRELTALAGPAAAPPLRRDELAALMRRFPDALPANEEKPNA